MDSAAYLQTGAYGYSLYSSQSGFQEGLPFMDHWNTFRPPVSLRNIMIEEQVIQDSLEKVTINIFVLTLITEPQPLCKTIRVNVYCVCSPG